MSPTPIEWYTEAERLGEMRKDTCPHGKLGPCASCDQLDTEAQEVFENEGGSPGEGGEFIE